MPRLSPFEPSVVSVLLVASLSVALAQGFGPSTLQQRVTERLRTELLEESNTARELHGLGPFSADQGLARAAQVHAEENAARGVLDHGSPDPSRDTPAERIALSGVALIRTGENLALMPGNQVARDAVEGWLESPLHRRNLLDPDFTHVGFGVAVGPGGTYVAQLLGARPFRRLRAEARPDVREESRWLLTVDGPTGATAAVFEGARPLARLDMDSSRVVLPVPALDEPVHLVLGVASGSEIFRPSDAGLFEPNGVWRRDAGAPFDEAEIVEARLETERISGVSIELVYDDPIAPLRLLVDGRHLPEVTPEEGVLRAWLPPHSDERTVEVGLATGSGTIQKLESFTLTGGGAPELLPGHPSDLSEPASADAR